MQITSKYNLINNVTGWVVFAIALTTYWLTLEPTVSYWDCGEFITQADKLEIGHPPGNPIFMLTANFFTNFAFGDASKVALMVNAMSGLLSALTILLLFWTLTHLTMRLFLRKNTTEGMTLPQYLIVMGSGVVGALAYTWSDTFWFSAVEGEVYAFSSFCTALVFWLILKWENRADQPHSDRYLILIAYVIGVSIAVHLLNLLCIPAIVLVFTYRKWKNVNVGKSLLALLVSFAIIVFVLYGLVPGFIKVAGWIELSAVNSLGMPFNAGTIIYTVVTICVFLWALYELYVQNSAMRIRLSFCLGVLLSGMLFIGNSLWLGLLLFGGLIYVVYYLFRNRLPVRWLNVAMWSIAVIFIGYSSYAVILIRSYANPPLNQSQPNNVFDLSGYLNREQYGETPLLYGPTYQSPGHYIIDGYGEMDLGYGYYAVDVPQYVPDMEKGKRKIARGVQGAHTVPKTQNENSFLSAEEYQNNEQLAGKGGDYYVVAGYDSKMKNAPSMNMLLPRIHSRVPEHKAMYELWVPSLASKEHKTTVITAYDKQTKEEVPMISMSEESLKIDEQTGEGRFTEDRRAVKPTFSENLEFFFNYQLNHMYWRYFLWNFVGRQNDYNNQYGEKDYGNWISGIGFIDNARLGDQSLLPDPLGKDNRANNKFYFLPLILGLIGLIWQAFRGRKGIEQFWVVFFLFFMTGIAIVLYLNQPPLQPRERDYAFAGSFYAFAIWIGMGVAGIYSLLRWIVDASAAQAAKKKALLQKDANAAPEKTKAPKKGRRINPSLGLAIATCAIGLFVPLQMVSQTWDDHDRSGRTAALDYAINYLESLEPNAIIFCNGDNDTFPLWYAQEVEGVRPDVKIINLSYLQSDWYINQQRIATYNALGVPITATPEQIAYGRLDMAMTGNSKETDYYTEVPLLQALKSIYGKDVKYNEYGYPVIPFAKTYIPVNKEAAMQRGLYDSTGLRPLLDQIPVDLSAITNGQLSLSQLIMLDIIATNAANGWERPIYWAGTVGSQMYSMFQPYLRATGMTYQLVPYQAEQRHDTERSYNIVKNKYRWGGADNKKTPYFDETAGRMISFTRMTTFLLASDLVDEAKIFEDMATAAAAYQGEDGKSNEAGYNSYTAKARENYRRAIEVLNLSLDKLPIRTYPYNFQDYYYVGSILCEAGKAINDEKAVARGISVLRDGLKAYAQNVKYVNKLIERYGQATMEKDNKVYKLPAANVKTSVENNQILGSYYQMMLEYDKFAGNGAAEKLVRSQGISEKGIQLLKDYYNAGSEDVTEDVRGYGADDIFEQINLYAPNIIAMQQMSDKEYRELDDESLQIDSLFFYMVDMYEDAGGNRMMLVEALREAGVDVDRSERIYYEFVENNLSLFTGQ